MALGEENDEALVARAGRGDRAAASALVLRHTDRIFAASYRMLGDRAAAEDATQETFLKLWKNAARWRPQGAKFETWLYKVAMNACLDRLRKRGREAPEDAAPEMTDGAPRADDILIAAERRDAVAAAIAALPERQREAIVLCHYQELSNIEAAKIMDVSVEAIESLLARGRRALKDALIERREELMEGGRHDGPSVVV
ncbi:MAG: RNA polymerase sigma factor [Alphaproteobacteria bacterium]|nr:RNA polymerase sigma factor [Alphaproteobacteria bacterium]